MRFASSVSNLSIAFAPINFWTPATPPHSPPGALAWLNPEKKDETSEMHPLKKAA